MKNLLLIALLLASMAVHAQKVKNVEITGGNNGYLTCSYIIDKDTTVQISLLSRDNRYQQLIELVYIYIGTPAETVDFFNDVEKIVTDNEADTWLELNGKAISIYDNNRFVIYDFRGSNGYHVFTLKQWQQLKKDLNNYMLVNEL